MLALVPALFGAAVGALLPWQAWREIADPDGRAAWRPLLVVLMAVPMSAPILALVGTLQAPDATVPLALLGAAALAQGVLQGVLARRAIARAPAPVPEAMGSAIVQVAIPEALTVAALAFVLLSS